MRLYDFAGRFYIHQNKRLDNVGRPYLSKIYNALESARRTVLCTARQCEKSTTLIKLITFNLVVRAPTTALLILPRQEQIHRLVASRLHPIIEESPILKRCLVASTRTAMKHIVFSNGSELILDSAYHNPDAARGVSARILAIDEFQDCATNSLAVLEETQSHQTDPHTVISGTAKLSDNELERAYVRGTANVWMISCQGCGQDSQANEQILGADGYRCPGCQQPLNPALGIWKELNPGSTFAESFRIPQLIVPWMNFSTVLEKKQTYQFAQFKNEVLGESITEGDLSLTLSDLTACCTARPPIETRAALTPDLNFSIIAGIDWGNTGHATTSVCLGTLDTQRVFHVLNWFRLMPGKSPDEVLAFVADICRGMNVSAIAVDSQGNGSVFRPMLFDRLQMNIPNFGMSYTEEMDFSTKVETDYRHLLSMNKTKAISDLVFRVKSRRITFPRQSEMETYLLEVASERCVPDEERRVIRYVKSPGRPDDALHSLIYALSAANFLAHRRPFL